MESFVIFALFLNFSPIFTKIHNVPPGFKFGVSTASYQIEGGWKSDGKGENIWDRYTHTQTDKIKDHSTGDIACDSYNRWQEDINMLKDMGVDFYRFSLSWSRILPNGFENEINPSGVQYYDNLINALLEQGIEPLVTLFHWDLPQPIQDLGGWTNYETVNYFVQYANISFSLFGDRVKKWITINEPASVCVAVYENGNGAPGIVSNGIGSYICGKVLLLAHAQAYRLYQRDFKHQDGKVGISIDTIWAEPKTKTQQDIDAAEREMQMSFGWYANPIFSKDGDYPDVMKSRIAILSSKQNFSRSRLPSLSKNEIDLLKGSADFLGLNHYHTWMTVHQEYSWDDISFLADKGTQLEVDPTWEDPEIVPWGFRKLLNWIKDQYNNPLVYITENGIGDQSGTLNDTRRVNYLNEYLQTVFVAIKEDRCNVARYTVWSLMDNMEWTDGYTIKFGLYNVNFQDSKRTRTLKSSGQFYKGVITGKYSAMLS